MRVFQHLFDYGDTGIVALSTGSTSYGFVPAADYGTAELWRSGKRIDLFDLCTREVALNAQRDALARLRAKLQRAMGHVHRQLDWTQAHLSEEFRELPAYAMQMGGDMLFIGFVGAIEPESWRLIDVAQQRILWDSEPDWLASATRAVNGEWARRGVALENPPQPMAAGAGFVKILSGMATPIFVLEGERLVAAQWSLRGRSFPEDFGVRSGMLSQPDREKNSYVLVDPRTGESSRSFPAPTRSKHWSPPATTPGSDRVAISHKGGTVDIVDGFGDSHFSIRPFPEAGRNEQTRVRLSNDGDWLGADGWSRYRVVNLATREVAELPVPKPNLTDDPERVLFNRDVLATRNGVAVVDETGFSLISHADLPWQSVGEPVRGNRSKSTKDFRRHLAVWRKPALSLKQARKGRSWLYGASDLPERDIPRHGDGPMRLLARIDLADVAAMLPDSPWPKQGALHFFTAVDSDDAPLLDEQFNPSATRVVWSRDAGSATPASEHSLAPRQALKLAVQKSELPDIGAAIVEAARLNDADLEAYRAWMETTGRLDPPSGNRLGGYPTILQHNDLEARAALLAGEDPTQASRWRLLLQLDSDDTCMWGTDRGMLYFLIDDADLAREDFSRVVAITAGC
jgi:uncharacterized protein YwqG